MPVAAKPSFKQSYWGCDTITNQAIWAITIALAIAGGTLLGEGYHIRDGPHTCFSSYRSCVGNFSIDVCIYEYQCNGTWLSNGTCTSWRNAWCEKTDREYLNNRMAAGIALLVLFAVVPFAFLFSRAPIDPNEGYEDEGVYVAVANPVQAPKQTQLAQPLRS